jgi:diguanylate cyclase (GGDEF)-like protein
MADQPTDVKKKLDGLRQAYLQKLPEKISEAEANWRNIGGTAWQAETFVPLHRMIHSLTGSSAVFDLQDLSNTARKLEKLLRSILDGEHYPPDQLKYDLPRYLAELRKISTREIIFPGPIPGAVLAPPGLPGEKQHKLIFLVDDDPFTLEQMSIQIRHFGYSIKTFDKLEEAAQALQETIPAAIVMNVVFPEGDLAGIDAIVQMRQQYQGNLPVIFISQRYDITARLQAARAGGDAYLVKPVNIIGIVEKLDALTLQENPDPFRILIVEDESEAALYYSYVLEQAGMRTAIVNDPLQVLDPLIEFQPDLVLTDVYMPGCTGIELAKIIRQMEAFVSIPIVFLSAENNIDKQLRALQMGGDDFLTKPIEPNHLIASVATRAERMRIMRSFMEKDGLTGLLNHTKTREKLNLAVERALRQKGELALAMIDLDHFKNVNDTYGHFSGDRVLTGLARLLLQRLRKTDLVGRYGGEEFAVILLDTDIKSASGVLNEIRESFSHIHHLSGNKKFNVTFSCGIAAFPHYQDAQSLSLAADKALYISKNAGRNRVTILEE